MEEISYYANFAAFLVISALWFVFGAMFFLRARPQPARDAKREEKSWLGLILQGVAIALVWAVQRRPVFSPLVDGHVAVGFVLTVIAVLLAVASVWLAVSAREELGRQWSLAARLTEDHKLVTTGVYRFVRHPIYTAMLGIMLATGIVISHWLAIVAATVVFYIGTKIRTRFEEKLLGEAFGTEFIEWKARVPGLIPFIGA